MREGGRESEGEIEREWGVGRVVQREGGVVEERPPASLGPSSDWRENGALLAQQR